MFKFFKKPAFSLDISDYSIELICLKGNINNPRLLAMERSILEPGIIEDGRIINKEALKKILAALIRSPRFGKLKTKRFIFSLSESKTFILIFSLPKNLKKRKELEFIKAEASQILPLPLRDICFDFEITRRENSKEVFLAAVQKNIINDYLEVFKSLKLYPLVIETESLALARSLINDPKETTLIVDIGARNTNFSIFDSGKLRFSRTLDVAGNRFTISLADGLGVSFSEAENLKKGSGLNPKTKKGKSFLILQRDIQTIVLEIRNIERYFQKKENKEIKKIILAGGSSMLPLLPQYLEENLEKPVAIGDPWARINIDILKKKKYFKEALEINPILYATCIGSSLRGLLRDESRTGINLIRGLK